MEADIKDVWMILKASWAPQPRWLYDEAVESSSHSYLLSNTPATARPMAQQQDASIVAFNPEVPSIRREEAPSLNPERRSNRGVRLARGARVERDLPVQLVPEHRPVNEAMTQQSHAQEPVSKPAIRNRKRKFQTGNVVELRPRLRNEMYANDILNALCAACEAHAAGEDELLMERIKALYHLFDDVVR